MSMGATNPWATWKLFEQLGKTKDPSPLIMQLCLFIAANNDVIALHKVFRLIYLP